MRDCLHGRLCSILPFYQKEKSMPARGDNTIMIMEKVKDSMEINVVRCSGGNISCRSVLVLTCSASSPNAETKPPAAMSQQFQNESGAKYAAHLHEKQSKPEHKT